MKITKKQLKRIIQEELRRHNRAPLSEAPAAPGPLEGAAASASSIAGGLRSGQLTPESAADRIEKEVKKVLYDFIRTDSLQRR